MAKEKDLNVLSLFSGCGGMDLGFEGGFTIYDKCVNPGGNFIEEIVAKNVVRLKSTRFKIVFANDILKPAFAAWRSYFRKYGYSSDIYRRDSIVDLVRKHKSGINVFPDGIDVVTGGFPCQDFSVAGKRKGFNSSKDHNGNSINGEGATEETRGKLYYWMKEAIDITKPKLFIAENVKGLVNLENIKDIIQKDFASADGDGYIVLNPRTLNAADYGVPQSRERVIFIGIKKSALRPEALKALTKKSVPKKYDPYPEPTHAFVAKGKGLAGAVRLKDIFSSLEEPEVSSDLSQKYYSRAKYMGARCQGQKEVNLSSVGPTIRSEHHGNIEYRRLAKKHGGAIAFELAKGYAERRLTPRECALIQTFPSDYEFVIPNERRKNSFELSPSAAYKVIGNAVPPLLAYHIAKRIESIWELYFE
ncbi:MAG: DNA cytosine methyltransferase [Prevotellaceae bacterium]|jgi:DNA (cytosine-5)-methyltransferase 1|nr:DNA cytosine methyltransferase [Prevotellaceae bacterium]